jgi:hypothetical protein
MEWPENFAIGDIPGGPRIDCDVTGALFGEDIENQGKNADARRNIVFHLVDPTRDGEYPDFEVTNRTESAITEIRFLCQWQYKDGPIWNYTDAIEVRRLRQEYREKGMEIKPGETARLIYTAYLSGRKLGPNSEHRCRVTDVGQG